MCYWPCQVFSSYKNSVQNKRRRSGFTDAVGKHTDAHISVFCSPYLAPKLGERGAAEAVAWCSCLRWVRWCPQDAGGLDETEATSGYGQQDPGVAAGGPCDALHASHGTRTRRSDNCVKHSIICLYHDTQLLFGPTYSGELNEHRTGQYLNK